MTEKKYYYPEATSAVPFTMSTEIQKKIIEMDWAIKRLELRVAELIKERDEYDKRRREAMEKTEDWRQKYWELVERAKREENEGRKRNQNHGDDDDDPESRGR